MPLTPALFRKDGWKNLLTGLGKAGTDKTRHTQFDEYVMMNDDELSRFYIGDGLGKTLVDMPADDMTRAGITIHDDDDDKIFNEFKRLDATQKLNRALKYMRLYRGAIVVIIPEGNATGKMDSPLPEKIKGIQSLRVYSAPRIGLTDTDIVTNPVSPYFDDVEIYPIQLRNGDTLKVHVSRCLVFKGEPAPDFGKNLKLAYRYWGMSALQPSWERLRNLGGVEQSIANLMMEIVVGKYKLSNLAKLLNENSTESTQKIYHRMEVINASKSLINAVLLGEGEEYTRDTANVAGVADLMDRMMMMLSSVSGIPVTRLFGRSPAGLNATGEGDLRNYYDDVSSSQEVKLRTPLQQLLTIISGYTSSTPSTFSFNSLWEPTEKERAEINKLRAEADKLYVEWGIYTAEEIQIARGEL